MYGALPWGGGHSARCARQGRCSILALLRWAGCPSVAVQSDYCVFVFSYSQITDHKFLSRGFSLDGLFYFSIGIFLQKHRNIKVVRCAAVVSAFLGVALLATKITFFYNTWKFQISLGKLSIPLLMYATWFFMPPKRLPDWLASCSFPIFLMHMLFFPYIGIALKRLHIGEGYPTLQPMLNFAAGFLGSIIVANLLRRFLPKLAHVLFGGR